MTLKKKLKALLLIFIGLVIISGGILFHYTCFLPIQKIIIQTDSDNLNSKQIQQSILPFIHADLFSLQLLKLKTALQLFPSVSQVSVRRVFPDRVVIFIRTKVPMARWKHEGFLDKYGEVFQKTASSQIDTNSMPIFYGSDDSTVKMLDYYEQMDAVLAVINLKIQEITLNNLSSWRLQLNNGMIIYLGWEKPLAKLKQFVKLYSKILSSKNKQAVRVDFRYPHGMAVKWVSL